MRDSVFVQFAVMIAERKFQKKAVEETEGNVLNFPTRV